MEHPKRKDALSITIDSDLKTRFPELRALTRRLRGVKVEKRSPELKKFGEEMMEKVKRRYDLESLKDLATFRAYRDFFWRIGIDPTKNRPAAEALIRRVLRGKNVPNVNTLVDAYNLASMETEIALAAFDADKLKGDLLMRFAERGELFLGIGMREPMRLRGGEIVISDAEKLIAIYPHRDAENTKVTEETRNVLLMVCGVPGLEEERLRQATERAVEYVTKFCDGDLEVSGV